MIRARLFGMLERVPGRVGEGLRRANEAVGRPLAGEAELEDRRRFARRTAPGTSAATGATEKKREAAPVIVYFVDRKDQKRDVRKLTDVLDAHGVAYTVTNIEDDPAAQAAVRRDSQGARLPVVFVAGECIGGREQLVNAASSGELKRKVFG